jgi:photoactive yellow protein
MGTSGEQPIVLDGLTEAELDALPYGVILLDKDLLVRAVNRAESRESGFAPAQVLGKHYFEVVAPSTNLPAFRDRVEDAMRRAGRAETFQYVFREKGRQPRRAVITTFAAKDGGAWIVARAPTP